MRPIRSTVTAVLDGVIGGLATVRGRVAPEDDAQVRPADPTLPASVDPTLDDSGALEAADPGGSGDDDLGRSIRDAVSSAVVYEATALRHPVAAEVEHLSSIWESAGLNRRFVEEVTLATSDARRRRIERIRRRTESERSVAEDAKAFAADVDWGRTWLYGKVGYRAGRRYGKRLPVADEYAPIAGAVAGGAYGAVSTATGRGLVDVDPQRLFDRIDALARLRDDPVTRASVAREAIDEIDRRIAADDDPLPVEDVVPDEDVARAVTTADEAVPDEIRIDPATRDLITRDLDRALPAGDRHSGDVADLDLPVDGDEASEDGREGEGDETSDRASENDHRDAAVDEER